MNHPIAAALAPKRPAASRAVAAQPVEPLLLSPPEAAALLGVSLRKFYMMRGSLPLPVQLGGRFVRWRRSDLTRWIEGLAAAAAAPTEPAQLAAGRARKRGTSGSERTLDGRFEQPVAESEAQRGLRIPDAPPTGIRAAEGGASK